MIKDIEITNFRCFDRLKVSGCKRINLISGKNNVGKTALLEAVFLNSVPTKNTIVSIGDLRRESIIPGIESSERMWRHLFFNQNIDELNCTINTIYQDKTFKNIKIAIEYEKEFFDMLGSRMPVKEAELYKRWLEKERFNNEDEHYLGVMIINIDNNNIFKFIALSRNHEISLEENVNKQPNTLYLHKASFISSTLRVSGIKITTEFDHARLNEKEADVLRAFQIIDSSIVAVESFSIPEPTIYLRRQGEKRLPLALFGDAMNRTADIILKVINNQDSILLIDEIENGIHHSSQIALWDFLYKLAEQLNVQIFATTHSLEMTEAFIKAGLDRPDSAAHFELTRHEKTNKIVAINPNLETLEYALDRNKEVRGRA